jgi:two-component system, chemotaxis family, protein-glutamate methylesterase/glutaminase
MSKRPFDVIAIGGSAGSLPVVLTIVNTILENFCVPVVLVIHRMKNVPSEMNNILSVNKQISEPEDKEQVKDCCMYLAPQNYHLLVEDDKTFSLDYSEPVNYSRPSIDVTFSSIADVYKGRTLGVLLSGANKDGAEGLNKIINAGGTGIVQDPETAEYKVMPKSGIEHNPQVMIMKPEQISAYINNIIA